MPPKKRGRVAKKKAVQDAGAEPIADEEPEPVDAGLLLEPEAKLSSEKCTPESSQASEVLEEPAVLEQVMPRRRGKQAQARAPKKSAGKQALVDETNDHKMESESSSLSEIPQLPEVSDTVPCKTKRNRKKIISNRTTSQLEEKEELVPETLIMPPERVPLKSKGKGRGKVPKKETSNAEQEDLETEWAVSSCSDDSRKNVVLIRRRRSDVEQQSEDGATNEGNAMVECVAISAACSSSSISQQQLNITQDLGDEAGAEVGALESQQNVESIPDSISVISQPPDNIPELATPAEKSKSHRRSLRNRPSDGHPTNESPKVEQRVTRSGRKIASRGASLPTETALASNASDLQSTIIQPFVTSTTDVAEVLETSQNVLAPITYEEDSLKEVAGKQAVSASVFPPTKESEEIADPVLVEEVASVSPSVDGSSVSLPRTSQLPDPGTPFQRQVSVKSATPESVSVNVEKYTLVVPAEQSCRDDYDSKNSNLEDMNGCPSAVASSMNSLATHLDQVLPVSRVAEHSDTHLESNVIEVDPVLDIANNDGLFKVMDSLVTDVCSNSKADLDNVSSVPVSCTEPSGTVRNLPGTDSELSSDEIPLKKRRIRAAFSSTDNSSEKHSEEPEVVHLPPAADISGEVLTERHVNIPDSVDIRQVDIPVSVLSVRHQNKFVGGHVSLSGNVSNVLRAAHKIGSRALGMFIKRQSSLLTDPLSNSDILEFKSLLKTYGIAPHLVVPHASYLLNCGSGDESELENSRLSLVDDLKRCQSLGLPLFNFHPGTCKGNTVDDCIDSIAATINYAHSRVSDVTTVLENMCGQVNTIGGTFPELRRIINRISDKSRVGVCLDTCHAFAAGYELNTESGRNKMMEEFTRDIGLNYLKAIHVNDSEDDVGSHRDHHAAIGQGKIGLECFKWIMNEPLFDNIPIILETPGAGHKAEIELLYRLCD